MAAPLVAGGRPAAATSGAASAEQGEGTRVLLPNHETTIAKWT